MSEGSCEAMAAKAKAAPPATGPQCFSDLKDVEDGLAKLRGLGGECTRCIAGHEVQISKSGTGALAGVVGIGCDGQ